MMNAQMLTVSSKGQVALPIAFRRELALQAGDKLVAYTSGDAIVMKVLKLPPISEFEKQLDEAQAWAAEVGYTESDVDEIIASVRSKRK